MATNSEEFTEWMQGRNKFFPNEPVPQNLFTRPNMNLLTFGPLDLQWKLKM